MRTVRRPLAVVAVLLTAACATTPESDLSQSLAGVPSADAMHGVRLGMPLADLRRLRPSLRRVNGLMIDTIGGYAVSYQIDRGDPDSALVGVWTSREFESREAMTAAWRTSVSAGAAHLGQPVACYDAPVAEGASPETRTLQAVLWERGAMHLSAMASSRSRATSAMFYDAARVPHDRRNHFELTVQRRRTWDRLVTDVASMVAPQTPHTCTTVASAPSTVAASGTAGVGR